MSPTVVFLNDAMFLTVRKQNPNADEELPGVPGFVGIMGLAQPVQLSEELCIPESRAKYIILPHVMFLMICVEETRTQFGHPVCPWSGHRRWYPRKNIALHMHVQVRKWSPPGIPD